MTGRDKGSGLARRGCRAMFTLALVALTLIAALAAGFVGVGYWIFTESDVIARVAPEPFEVRRGEGPRSVLRRLVEDGTIEADRRWEMFLLHHRPARCLQAGPHVLPERATPTELFAALCETAYAAGVRLTMPEGTNLFQLADRVAETGLAEREALIAAGWNAELLAAAEIDAPSFEGYLAPETYELAEDATAADVLLRLAAAGAALRAEVFDGPRDPVTEAYSLHQLLTIASIVEEEATVAEERATIARVIYNRLERGMRIQCDPTCIYRADAYDQVPTRALCRDPASTHSTYVLPGLPPTPISSPGGAAIEATLRPAADPDVLYFVAIRDGTGRHAFANTLAEHESNVRRYLR